MGWQDLGWVCPQSEENKVFHKDLLGPLEMGTEYEERPQQMVCCRAGAEAGRSDLEEEWREMWGE